MNTNSQPVTHGSNGPGDNRLPLGDEQQKNKRREDRKQSEFTGASSELTEIIERYAACPGNSQALVDAAVIAFVAEEHAGDPDEVRRLRESHVRQFDSERQRRQELMSRLRIEEPNKVIGRERISLPWQLTYWFLVVFLIVLLAVENTGLALLITSTEAFSLSDIWMARALMISPLSPAISLMLAIKLFPRSVRSKIYATAGGCLVVAFGVWVTAISIEIAKYEAESEASLPETAIIVSAAPSGEGSTLCMFLGLAVLMPASAFLAHSGLMALLHSFDITDENPTYTKLNNEVRASDTRMCSSEEQIATDDKKLAHFEAQRARALSIHGANYHYLRQKGTTVVLAFLASLILFASGCGGESSTEPKDTTPAAHFAVAISKNVTSHDMEKLADSIIRSAPGSSIAVMDGRGKVIARLITSGGVKRLRKKALVQPMRELLTFLENVDHNDEKMALGSINIPRISQSIAQLDEIPTRVCILGTPLFNSAADNDKPFAMTDGKVPSDSHLFDAMSPFSVLGHENALSGQTWFFGCEDNSAFTGELHQRRVERFWGNYLAAQKARVVYSGSSFSGAIDSMLRSKSPRALTIDEPNRSAPVEMVRISSEAAERTEQQEMSIVDRQTRFKQVIEQPPISAQDQQSHPDKTKQSKYNPQRNILILAFNNDSDVQTSPLAQTLRNEGFTVATLCHPLPPLDRFKSILQRADEVWVIASSSTDLFPDSHLNSIVERWRTGKLNIALLADNAPNLYESQAILAAVCPGARLEGNDVGGKTLFARSATALAGFAADSPLFKGIDGGLWEGTTISSIDSASCTDGLRPKTLCFSSAGKPLIATIEAGGSKCMVHTGYTFMYSKFYTRDASKFIVNAAHWLDPANGDLGGNLDENPSMASRGR